MACGRTRSLGGRSCWSGPIAGAGTDGVATPASPERFWFSQVETGRGPVQLGPLFFQRNADRVSQTKHTPFDSGGVGCAILMKAKASLRRPGLTCMTPDPVNLCNPHKRWKDRVFECPMLPAAPRLPQGDGTTHGRIATCHPCSGIFIQKNNQTKTNTTKSQQISGNLRV